MKELLKIYDGLIKVFSDVNKLERVNYTDYYWFVFKLSQRLKGLKNELIGNNIIPKTELEQIRKFSTKDLKYD